MSKETWKNNIKNWVDCAIDAGYEIPETAQKALESIISQSIQEAVLEERRRIEEAVEKNGYFKDGELLNIKDEILFIINKEK